MHVTFHVTEGPKVKIDEIDFVGNKAISRREARSRR